MVNSEQDIVWEENRLFSCQLDSHACFSFIERKECYERTSGKSSLNYRWK